MTDTYGKAAIEDAFVKRAKTIDGLRSATTHDPAVLPSLPCVALYFLDPLTAPREELGPSCDFTWRWQVRVYVELAERYEVWQDELAAIGIALVRLPLADVKLDKTCDEWQLQGDGTEPLLDQTEGWARKTLRMTAWTYERR